MTSPTTIPRRPLIAGNWKMNGLTADGRALALALAKKSASRANPPFDLLVCPPATLLSLVGAALQGADIALGGQDCDANEKGAHTGDISAAMLRDMGCAYAIVGHTERRADHGEDDALVRAKAAQAIAAGLTAIICIGETEAQRDGGEAARVVAGQLAGSLPEGATATNTIIAYEPVWAIGTGRTPSPDQVAEIHGIIREHIATDLDAQAAGAMRILYGGSVKPDNAAELLALADVDGALVGGASLAADDFWAIALATLE